MSAASPWSGRCRPRSRTIRSMPPELGQVRPSARLGTRFREVSAMTSLAERADALEHDMMAELDSIIVKSRLFNLADGDMAFVAGAALQAKYPGKRMLMGDDPRLPKMPDAPTLVDF